MKSKNQGFTILRLRSGSKTLSSSKGFTIVELLVVIVVIGILAAITIVSYSGIRQRANLATLKSDLKNASMQLETHKISSDNETYPSNLLSANIKASPGTTYALYYLRGNYYCLQANNSDFVYHINSFSKVPTSGECPSGSFALAWGGPSDDIGNSVIQTNDGGFAITGKTTKLDSFGEDMFLAKYNSNGSHIWSKTWGGTDWDWGKSVAQTNDGGFIVTGATSSYGYGDGERDVLLVKFDANGNLEWNRTWGGPGRDEGSSVIETSDGGFVVSGETDQLGIDYGNIFIAKFDSSGDLLWDRTWTRSSDYAVYSHSIIQTSDGGYTIAASSYTPSGSNDKDTIIIKYDSNGNLSWSRSLNKIDPEGGINDIEVSSIIQTDDGDYVLTGVIIANDFHDMFLAKIDATGVLSWFQDWNDDNVDSLLISMGYDLIQTSDGGYAVAGVVEGYDENDSDEDILLVKYNSSGEPSWSRVWSGLNDEWGGTSIAQTYDDGYILTGETESYGAGAKDMILIKYDYMGNINNCISPMCRTSTQSSFQPSVDTSPISSITSSPTATVTSPLVTVNLSTLIHTTIVAP